MSLAHPFSCSRTRIDRSCVATRVSMTSSSSNSSKKASTIFLIGTMSFTSSAKSTLTKCRSNSCHTRKPKCINLPSKVLFCHQSMNARWVSLNSSMRSPNTPTNRRSSNLEEIYNMNPFIYYRDYDLVIKIKIILRLAPP